MMFGTLHWNSHDQEARFIERPHGSSNLEKYSACDRCRAKKVKCSISEDGCSRCKRLGKRCSTNLIKNPGGSQRIRKGSVTIKEQEGISDLLLETSAQNARPHASQPSPSPRECGVEDGLTAQDLLGNISPHLDLSFLPELCHQTGLQPGADTSNIALASVPRLSSFLPSTPLYSTAVLPPPLSPQDEISSRIPPATVDHPQQLGSISCPTHPYPSLPCQCLAAVTFAVEEVETSCNLGNRAELDSIIAYQKDAIRRCRAMLKCNPCLSRRENVVLLAFMVEKLVSGSTRMVILYRKKDNTRPATSNSHPIFQVQPGSSQSDFVSLESHRHDLGEDQSCQLDHNYMPPDWREILLGDYEISSAVEWEHIMRVLIILQIWGVTDLLANMKNVCREALGEIQMARLAHAEDRLGELRRDFYML